MLGDLRWTRVVKFVNSNSCSWILTFWNNNRLMFSFSMNSVIKTKHKLYTDICRFIHIIANRNRCILYMQSIHSNARGFVNSFLNANWTMGPFFSHSNGNFYTNNHNIEMFYNNINIIWNFIFEERFPRIVWIEDSSVVTNQAEKDRRCIYTEKGKYTVSKPRQSEIFSGGGY